jgi:hypothetical protein
MRYWFITLIAANFLTLPGPSASAGPSASEQVWATVERRNQSWVEGKRDEYLSIHHPDYLRWSLHEQAAPQRNIVLHPGHSGKIAVPCRGQGRGCALHGRGSGPHRSLNGTAVHSRAGNRAFQVQRHLRTAQRPVALRRWAPRLVLAAQQRAGRHASKAKLTLSYTGGRTMSFAALAPQREHFDRAWT